MLNFGQDSVGAVEAAEGLCCLLTFFPVPLREAGVYVTGG
jgi:hypothetical protein